MMTCEFCGQELRTMMVPGMRAAVPLPCDCTGAVRQREELDRRDRDRAYSKCYYDAMDRARIPDRYTMYEEFGDGGSMYIYGEQGRGKTERACGALRKWVRDHITEVDRNLFFPTSSAKFVSVPELMMQLRKTYDTYGQTESDMMDSYAGVGMLALDDLGKGQMTPWAIERIYTLIDMRYRDGMPTVITSQYDPARLAQTIAAKSDRETALAIQSRIEGMCKIAHVGGPDWRTAH